MKPISDYSTAFYICENVAVLHLQTSREKLTLPKAHGFAAFEWLQASRVPEHFK